MRINKKILVLFGIVPLIVGCTKTGFSEIKSIDFNDAVTMVRGITNEDYKKGTQMTLDNFKYYAVNKDGEVRRLKFNTASSDDDKSYNSYNTWFRDFSKDYLILEIYNDLNRDQYFVNKKSGKASRIKDNSVSVPYNTTNTKQDSYGNVYSFSTKKVYENVDHPYYGKVTTSGQGLTKYTFDEDGKFESKVLYESLYLDDNSLGVDKYGNVTFVAKVNNNFLELKHITSHGQVFDLISNEAKMGTVYYGDYTHYSEEPYSTKIFWEDYDGEVYTNEDGYICKIAYEQDAEYMITGVKQEKLWEFENYNGIVFNPRNVFKIDATKEIYMTNQKDDQIDIIALNGTKAGKTILSIPYTRETYSVNVQTTYNDAFFFDYYSLIKIDFGEYPTYTCIPFEFHFSTGVNSYTCRNKFIYCYMAEGTERKIAAYDFINSRIDILADYSKFKHIDSLEHTFNVDA